MKKNGRCPAGQYYCYTNKECRPIPAGFMVDPEGMLRKENGASVDEGTLHKWFKSSKSKDGKSGWVNVVTGGTCASDEPGEGTPKCVSSAKRASMTKAERLSASRRKKEADPGQQQKSGAAKPTYVSTDKPKKKMNEAQERDHEYSMARSQLSTVMSAAKRLKNKMAKGEGNVEAWVQSKITKAADYLDSAADYVDSGEMKVKEEFTTLPLEIEIPTNIRDFNLGLMFRESLDFNKGMLFIFDEVGQKSFHMTETKIPLDIAFITKEGFIDSIKELEPYDENPVYSEGEVLSALEVNRGWFEENNIEVGDQIIVEQNDVKGKGSGKKDACYHKVKSRYSVWPSAYASGALVKCRKVGAANWGTKSEETNIDEKIDVTKQSSKRKSLGRGSSIKHGAKKTGYESPAEFRDTEKKLALYQKEENQIDEKCWPGYEKKGMKTMFGKKYPNCVKKKATSEATSFDINPSEHKRVQKQQKIRNLAKGTTNPNEKAAAEKKLTGPSLANEEVTCNLTKKGKKCPIHGIEECPLEEAIRLPSKTGNIILVTLTWRGKYYAIKMFFPQVSVPNRRDVQDQINKVYPGARVLAYNISEIKPGEQFLQTEDWQKVNRQDRTDGLSKAAVKAYRRENPGSKLQTAVTEKNPEGKRAKRRKSFCSRMKGMKKRLTSAETARDPDSRINKALRRWRCN